jgi:adenylyltransferase/sulfurtransferase
MSFSDQQLERYSRNIILKEVGGKGQKKLLAGRVLVLGAGGLGSPCAYYLAAMGVGKIGLVDSDNVDLSNLQRQILHFNTDINRPKTASAAEKLSALNPDIQVEEIRLRLTSGNILDVIKDYDIVVDGTDNFPTRYLANDACVMAGKPLVHAGILRFNGQIITILPKKTACFRCLFPSPPPPGAIPTCQEAGILGSVAGVLGSLMATEVAKFFLGQGELLTNRILIYDALEVSFREVKIPRNPQCPVCGDEPTIKELIDYEVFCGLRK